MISYLFKSPEAAVDTPKGLDAGVWVGERDALEGYDAVGRPVGGHINRRYRTSGIRFRLELVIA